MILSSTLNPWFVSGFSDAESSFSASISKNPNSKFGWSIGLSYSIDLSVRDSLLLEQIKLFFNLGKITYNKNNTLVKFRVRSLNDLDLIIQFFRKFPLLTSKRHDFYLFVSLFELLSKKEHLTLTGFMRAIALVNNINNPIKSGLLIEITRIYGPLPALLLPPVTILRELRLTLEPWWIIGFICGEGSFTYGAAKYHTKKLGERVKYQLVFELSQRTKDIWILESVQTFLNVGIISSEKRGISKVKIGNLNSIQHILIPFLLTYPIPGFKNVQFQTWLKAVAIKVANPSTYDIDQEANLKQVLSDLSNLRQV